MRIRGRKSRYGPGFGTKRWGKNPMASAVCKLKLRVALAFVVVSMLFVSIAASTVVEPAQAAQQRKLIIGRVVFENNKKLNDAQLSSVIDSKAQGVYNPAT